jgi:hypothetical protein
MRATAQRKAQAAAGGYARLSVLRAPKAHARRASSDHGGAACRRVRDQPNMPAVHPANGEEAVLPERRRTRAPPESLRPPRKRVLVDDSGTCGKVESHCAYAIALDRVEVTINIGANEVERQLDCKFLRGCELLGELECVGCRNVRVRRQRYVVDEQIERLAARRALLRR